MFIDGIYISYEDANELGLTDEFWADDEDQNPWWDNPKYDERQL